MRKFFASVLAIGAFTACNEDPIRPDPAACDPFLASYAVANGDTVAAAQGLRYIDIKAGSGEPTANGRGLAVHYSLYVRSNGQAVQTTCGTNIPFGPFVLGANTLVPGFERGVTGMRLGGVRRLIVPSALAYPAGSNSALAGVDLVWDVHLTQTDF